MRTVGVVDPNDDSRERFVIWHYRYDPTRREHRNVTVAAFDNADEFTAEFERLSATLK
jgi:hypothetical protein